MTDLHLGNINGVRFARRIADKARLLNPDVIFMPGDLFDGTKADPDKLAAPLYEALSTIRHFLRFRQPRGVWRVEPLLLRRSKVRAFAFWITSALKSTACR